MARISFVLVALSHLGYRLRKKNILASNKVTIYGLKNISTSGLLRVGLANVGFMNRHDRTFLNIAGKIDFSVTFRLGAAVASILAQVQQPPSGVVTWRRSRPLSSCTG